MGRHPRWQYHCSKWCRDIHQRCLACTQLCGGSHERQLREGLCDGPGGCWEYAHLCRDCHTILAHRSPDRRCARCRHQHRLRHDPDYVEALSG
jgi:hypothetical protein